MGSTNIDAWTAYWRDGRTASCFESADLEVRLTHLWQQYVDSLPPDARILDLATGNGTVARSCVARARARGIALQVEAVDAAQIDPHATVPDPQQLARDIRFRGGTVLEALPFNDASFDGVVSQFGFEYADEPQAAAEAARVLAPGGRMRFVLHAQDGAVSRDIKLRLQRLRSVLADTGAVTLVLRLARAAEAGDSVAVKSLSAHLAAASDQLRQLGERPPPDDSALFYSREFLQVWALRNRYRPADLRRSVENGWRNANGVAIRQEQMLRAARSQEDIASISERFTTAGLIVNPAIAIQDERRGVRMAWLLDAHKPADASAE
jgi:ubiquinone/menaquinone biosynthesis C-methylase UbiE